MAERRTSKIVIVGGGTAGWITASLLIRLLGRSLEVTLVESEEIATVGVGEATIPPIRVLNRALGIDEADFMRRTRATIKLGIQFENWGRQGDSYMHAFGDIGKDFPFCAFHHFWVRYRQQNPGSDFWDYSLNFRAAKAGKFAHLDQMPGTNLRGLVYAYHFDAGLYARYLREYSESLGVKRLEGLVGNVNLDRESGNIRSLTLADGAEIEGDLFVDCSGFRGLLIERALNTGFEDWGHWLPCDRAVTIQCESLEAAPYTRSIAREAGWQWRIPVQGRTGNGLVYSSRYLDDDQATERLLQNVDGRLLTDPRVIRFRTGRRRKAWNRNCVAVGLASGFIEPLESTSIHMVQSAVLRLVKHFPHRGIRISEVEEYNSQTAEEWAHIRDFIILHYHLNQRDDSDFWRYCANMDIPAGLSHKMSLFRDSGKSFGASDELFADTAWRQVMIGQWLAPTDFHPLAETLDDQQLEELMADLRRVIGKVVDTMSEHKVFLDHLVAGA